MIPATEFSYSEGKLRQRFSVLTMEQIFHVGDFALTSAFKGTLNVPFLTLKGTNPK